MPSAYLSGGLDSLGEREADEDPAQKVAEDKLPVHRPHVLQTRPRLADTQHLVPAYATVHFTSDTI